MPFAEHVARELFQNADLPARLEQMHVRGGLPQTYYTSPVAQLHGYRVSPYILYLDGVRFASVVVEVGARCT